MKSFRQAIISTAFAIVVALPLAAFASPTYLNAGALVTSKMNETIDSGSAHAGNRFTLTVTTPYPSNSSIYRSARLNGHVTRVVGAGQGKNPVLEFAIDRIVLADGRQSNLQMMLQSQETQRHNNMGNVALTAAAGMIVGNMLGKTLFKSNLGGAAGLIAGALYANNKRTNVSMRQGSVVVMEVRQTTALTYPSMTARAH